jgi:hypothetical protein
VSPLVVNESSVSESEMMLCIVYSFLYSRILRWGKGRKLAALAGKKMILGDLLFSG